MKRLVLTNHVEELRVESGIDCSFNPDIPERAQKADDTFAKDADINYIMSKYQKTGILPQTQEKIGQYLDTTQLPDLKQYYDIISDAEDAFASLPSQLRRKLDNDPSKLFEYLEDDTNRSELESLGLVMPRQQLNDNVTIDTQKKALKDV